MRFHRCSGVMDVVCSLVLQWAIAFRYVKSSVNTIKLYWIIRSAAPNFGEKNYNG